MDMVHPWNRCVGTRKEMVFFKLRVYKVCSLVNKDIIFLIHKYAKIISCMQEIITKAKKSMIILTLFLVC